MLERSHQRLILGAYLLDLITEANGGQPPRTIWEYRRGCKRFGVRLRVVASDGLQEALVRRGQRAGEHGVIYVRRTRNMAVFRIQVLHELAEVVTRWDGVPPIVCQVDRHEVAEYAVHEYIMTQNKQGFLAEPFERWPKDLREALALLVDMPEKVQADIVRLWLDQAAPHHELATKLRQTEEKLKAMEEKLARDTEPASG